MEATMGQADGGAQILFIAPSFDALGQSLDVWRG
jgi:hypothetical protein